LADIVLVVRHGPGRGRIPRYGEHILDWLRAERPDLARRIRLHETGTGPIVLDDVRGVFFWLADPLQTKYPDCYGEALAIEEEAERRRLPVMNRPTALAKYGKGLQARRFDAAGVPSPPAIPVENLHDLGGCADRWGLPLLVRGGQSFSQEGTIVLRSNRDLRCLKPGRLPAQPIVTPLVDVRGPRAGSEARDLWSRYYHRKRVLLIGDICVPYSLFFARTPVVSQETSVYADFQSWRRRLRALGRLRKPALAVAARRLGMRPALELESEFAETPLEQEDVFRRAGAALNLEFLAFDFASMPDGEILIWEANPYPYLPAASDSLLRGWRNREARARAAYQAFACCFEGLLGASPGA
jgi:hypothetical protein